MPFAPIGIIAASELFPTRLYGAGVKNVGPVLLPDRYTGGMILLDVSQVEDLNARIAIALQATLDGQVWVDAGGGGLSLPQSGYSLAPGLVDADGNPVRVAGFQLRFPESVRLTRQLQAAIALSDPAVIGLTMVIW